MVETRTRYANRNGVSTICLGLKWIDYGIRQELKLVTLFSGRELIPEVVQSVIFGSI